MKKTAIIPAMALFFVMLASCDLFPSQEDTGTGTFYAQNLTNSTFYTVKADMLYEGEKCEIWAEKGSSVTRGDAKIIAGEYDKSIRNKIIDTFGETNFSVLYKDVDYEFDDILDFANWLTGRNNKKITILLLDIKDGYVEGVNDSYVAGYFYAGNFYEKGKINNSNYYSNGRDMIYVDTDPGLKTQRTQTYATLAHELQHLVNFTTVILLDKDNFTDVWIDEGLSAYAEHLYLEGYPEVKHNWLGNKLYTLSSEENTIKTGNNFFVWGNHEDKPYAILDDYATVYLFFRWLYLQADPELQSHIFKDIITSPYYDYRAITSVWGGGGGSWEDLLREWLAANYFPENNIYGYKDDTELQAIIKIDPIGGPTVSLYPGEGVYSKMNAPHSFTNAGNIRYAGLDSTAINVSSPYSGDVLLTFNANTNNAKTTNPETGFLTGVSSSITVSPTAGNNARSVQQNGPYVIDAQDMLGRDQAWPKYRLPR